jgi:hypothetical protein
MIEEDEEYFAVFPQGSIWCGVNTLVVHIVIADLGVASTEESVLAGLTFSVSLPAVDERRPRAERE